MTTKKEVTMTRTRGAPNAMDGNSLSQRCTRPLWRVEQGFSLVELLVVIAISLTVSVMALVSFVPSVRKSNADTAKELVLGEMRHAHERAIDDRRIYRLTFVAPQTITLEVGTPNNLQINVTGGAAAYTQAQPPLVLPKSIQFLIVAGIPTGGAVPDGFGSGVTAIDFDVNNGSGGQTAIYFQPDGRALDSLNRITNGVVYVAESNQLFSSRAVSLYGSTGRVKGWILSKNPDGSKRWTQ
jgi:prepilin-type N-terminal cleavage/methylation domain-containing protein